MKQIIPFEKELLLHTKINEVTSISLEHTLKLEDNCIKGEFIITGDYKMTATSINREKFNFNLPVEIDVANNYDYEKAIVDIDNFYYEIINDDSIKVNIDVYVDVEKKDEKKIIIDEKNNIEDTSINDVEIEEDSDRLDINVDSNIDIDVNNINNGANESIDDVEQDSEVEQAVLYDKPNKMNINDSVEVEDISDDSKVNFFNTDDFSNDTYATYYIYIVKDDDNLDKVIEKFNTSKEQLANYNDISNLKRGDKLIIPVIDE